jgi:prevent-host-death family protein
VKSVSDQEAQANFQDVLAIAQNEQVVITRQGKPSVVVLGLESYDEEDLRLAGSPEFWNMIQLRRQGRSIPLTELKARLGREEGNAGG